MLAPYLAFAKKSFLNKSAYGFDHFMGILNTIIYVFIYWGIYIALYGKRDNVDGITLMMVMTNFILSLCLNAIFYVDDFYLPNRIHDGSIANELLLPVSVSGRMLAENIGNAFFKLIYHFTPALIICVICIGIQPPKNLIMLCLFIISALLGYGVMWAISYMVQMCAFWLINIWSIMTIKNVFINVLSGSMIPLWFMPEWLRDVTAWLPFSSIYFTPIQIYLGQLSYSEILLKCGLQLVWIAIIFLIGRILWSRGKRKLVVQGG